MEYFDVYLNVCKPGVHLARALQVTTGTDIGRPVCNLYRIEEQKYAAHFNSLTQHF